DGEQRRDQDRHRQRHHLSAGLSMPKLSITCTEFKPFVRNTLRGFATIIIAEMKLEIREIHVHEHERGARWAVPPAKPMIGNDGVALRAPTAGSNTSTCSNSP